VPPEESRRASVASQASRTTVGIDTISSPLDVIHTTASKSDTLTTFDEFASPPRPTSSGDVQGFAGDIVQGGLSGLYSRLKASVGGGRESLGPSPLGISNDATDDSSIRSATSKKGGMKSTSITNSDSPVASAPSSRLQSPLIASFPEGLPVPSKLQPSPSNASLLSRISVPDPHLVSTGQTPPSPDEARLRPNSNSPKCRPSSTPRPVDRKKPPRIANVSDLEQHAHETLVEGGAMPDIKFPRQTERHSFSSNSSSMLDQERTPRPLARFAVDNQRSFFDSSLSPVRRDTSRHDWSDKNKAATITPEKPDALLDTPRPPLIKIGQSHLPGFQASRATSTDGDYSSVTSGAQITRKHSSQQTEDNFAKGELPSLSEVQDATSRMRSKVLAKELWMRDETAKECFYCGEAFSTFRRKHHCRKFSKSVLHTT
jgi:1-phosphatidylinositol-3-phosphate 5-kinase